MLAAGIPILRMSNPRASHTNPLRFSPNRVKYMQPMFTWARFFILGLLCSLAFSSVDQPAPAKPADVKPDYSKEAFVVEEDVARIDFENDGTDDRWATTRIRIQSQAGVDRYSVLLLSYENATETIEIPYVRVKKADGTVIETPADNIQDMAAEITRQAPFYSDLREKHVAVKGLGVGDVLEYEAHWHMTKPLIPGQFWFAGSIAGDSINLHSQLQISIPRGRQVKWKSPVLKPAITDDAARRTFTWTTSRLEHKLPDEEKKDSEQKLYQAVRGKAAAPDVQLSSFQSWEELGTWYNNLQKDREAPSAEIRAKAAEITKNASDDNAKLNAIYNYVSTQFHYIGVAFGIGRYQPHSAAEVLGNQYGDCKDKQTLLASLLDAVGIKAYPALISSSRDVDPDVPSPAQFDHLIGAVPQGSSFTWLDTTSEVAPFGYLMSVLRDKHALVIPPDKPALLITTPADPPTHPVETFTMDAKLNEGGTLEGKAEQQASGMDAEVVIRAAFRRVPLMQWKDLAEQMARVQGFGGEVSEVTASAPEKTSEPFHWSYTYTRKEFPDWANRRVVCALPLMLMAPPDTEPSTPIWLGSPQEYHYVSHMELPKGYLPQLPGNINLTEDFAEYHVTYSGKGGVLTTDRRLVTKVHEVPLSEYAAYKKFAKAVTDDYDRYVNLSSSSAQSNPFSEQRRAIEDLPMSNNPDATHAYDDAVSQSQDNDAASAITSLKRAIDADPNFVRASILLSELYRFKGQNDLALETLQNASDANPGQPVLQRQLVAGLMGMRRYDQALPLLQRWVKDNPDDLDGLNALGSPLSGLKRYGEAAGALESAIAVAPDRGYLYAQLGYAYMNAGNDAKAMPALKKAVELDPKLYNDVAYSVADANKYLPLALEYAQKAVRNEEEASASVTLADLKVEDLQRTALIAAYWDTLGWVYFKMSNLGQAERYLNAGWTLAQDGVIAAHLGQVYERENKKEAAIRMYRLARYRLAFGDARVLARLPEQMKETGALLDHLSPGTSSNLSAGDLSDTLTKMRTFRLPRLLPGAVTAEVFLLLDQNSKIEDVKVVTGSEKLASLLKKIGSAGPTLGLPDDTSARLLRRGFLDCYPSSGCVLVLLNPSDVHSVK